MKENVTRTIIRSVTALICVVAICFTANAMTSTLIAAKSTGTAADGSTGTVATDGTVSTDGTATDGTATDGIATDGTATDGTATDGTAAAGTATDGTASGTAAGSSSGTASGTAAGSSSTGTAATGSSASDPTKMNKAQVVAYYNAALKKTYTQKFSASKTETISIKVDSTEPKSSLITSAANSIVSKYAKPTKSTFKSTGDTTKAMKFLLPANLEAAGAKSATAVKNGTGYKVTIAVVSEGSTLTSQPKYNTQCSWPLDLAKVDLSPIKITQANFSYPSTVIVATIDNQGRVTSLNDNMPITNGTGTGKLGVVSLTAHVHGSWVHQSTVTY